MEARTGLGVGPLAPAAADIDAAGRAIVHMSASLLLDYPAEGGFAERLDAVAAALADAPELPPAVSGPLEEFVAEARARGTRALAEHYVEVFDRRRRCCLYLSYYAVGDTRYRGAALLAFKQALAAAGYELDRDELPDYLPVVLELSARSGDEVADVLLSSHRDGLEVLRRALSDAGSPYARLLDAVVATLPAVDAATAARVRALVAAGPPTETVGVTDALPFPTMPPAPPVGRPSSFIPQEQS
ncbi:MAG: nitrate reductase molybdenum cofactor assembly chaperone [Actinomyces ruminicola]|uniref:Respiratory nitrate reductase chaperone NarJ n=2 Tax=Actinomyces ruminicola TaxID=332524 RepID=A0A1G9W9I2_9ACTO|nr:nitrate reductase molybdenum cofactor assembly chaperone [Actinomyces ruminicola]MBE6481698.1 nitrate reductase molybdenum cofactor assembly chaperone [Actinomyces ruminicola]SDM81182.1 respiratory nitrate reductase chaperone NarJ [Actinomyces ruminicola]